MRFDKRLDFADWMFFYTPLLLFLATPTPTFFAQIDRPNLAKQLIRAVQADPTIPPLSTYKMSDRVTWAYYLGLLAFRAGDDVEANERLGWAWDWCYEGSRRNQE